MARKKLNLAWIANDSTRRATFKKRKKGLMKKAGELATLCNVRACMVIYGPQEPRPEAWPSAPEAARVLARFRSVPEMEQCRRMMNQEVLLHQRASKLQEQLRRQERHNRELEVAHLMHEVLAGRRSLCEVGLEDATTLAWMVDTKLKAVQERMKQEASTQLALRSATGKEVKHPMEMAMESLQRQNWLVMNPNENVVFGSGEEIMPIPSIEHDSPWLDPFFPFI